ELWNAIDENSSLSGLLMAESTPLIISIKPILTSQRTGPFQGYLIMVRYLGDEILAELRETTGMDMDLLIIGWNSPMDISNFPDSNPLPDQPEMIYHISGQTIIGYTTLYDVLNHTALFLRIDNPRTVYGLAQQTVLYLLLALILTGLVYGGFLYYLMGRMVLTPVTSLDNSIRIIADSGNLTRRVEIHGKDEITDLSRSMNSMLLNLQHSQEEVNRRLVQLQTAAEVSRTISSVLDPQELLQQVVDLIKVRFDLYYVGLFLMDDKKENAMLQAGTGEPGQIMVNRGHHLAVGGTSMIGWSTRNRQARISLDTDYEETRFSNPLLPSTRSEMALPILTRAEVLGALSIQSEQRNAFDENDILVLQSIADSLAVALDNARLFQQARQSLDEIRRLNQAYLHTAWEEAIQQHDQLKFTYESTNIVSPASTPISLPISLRDQIIGSVELETSLSGLTEEEKAFIESVTIQTALALENARLLEQSQRRASQEEKINQIVTQFSRASNVEQILKSTLQELGQLPNVAEVTVQLLHAEDLAEKDDGNGHHEESGESSGE
ncbi:MAG TPA: GAF domain-containing protein, partial [Longilinea sp.]|nr:GAF domain-containing protein [Longilinea sp.]